MDTIKSSYLTEFQETSNYIDRAIQYIVTHDGLRDNLPAALSDMMLYLFETRDIYRLMASKEKQGHEARTIISCLSCQPTKKEAADASNFIEFLDMSIEWIVTSDGLQDNFPIDFDLMMSHLFKAKKFFQSLVKASNFSVITPPLIRSL